MLQKGANPNVRIKIDDPKFEQGVNGGTFYYVSNPPDVAVAVSTLNWDGATAFWVAAKNADAPYMRLLAKYGADPLMPNRVKVTPLMAAAGAGFMQGEHPGSEADALEAAQVALELGNDVNAVADFGAAEDKADLRFSGQRGANSIVELLVAKGARLDVKTREGWTPFNIADGIQIGGTLKNSPATAALLRKLMTEKGLPVEEYHYEDNARFKAVGAGGGAR
jgi:ankyrin repeat protein